MDLAYQLIAAKYIRRQTKQLAAQSPAVRAARDIEAVHRARVASRRLRAALRVFSDAFAAKKIDRWRRAIRRITSALGDARDRDVQIELLCRKLSELQSPECFPGLARILVDAERDRERFQRRVVKAVNRLERSEVLETMQRAARRVIKQAETDRVSAAGSSVLPRIEPHVTKHLDELLHLEDSLDDPAATDRHHAMRIATKRLRYTLELSRPLCPGQLDPAIDSLKKLQSLLGEIHDCDVWVEHLQEFADGERRRIAKLFGHEGRFTHVQAGIEYLESDRIAHRQATFAELGRYWSELRQQHVLERLRSWVRGEQAKSNTASDSTASVSAGQVGAIECDGQEPGTATPSTPAAATPSSTASDGLFDGQTPARKPLLTTGF